MNTKTQNTGDLTALMGAVKSASLSRLADPHATLRTQADQAAILQEKQSAAIQHRIRGNNHDKLRHCVRV